MLYNDAWQPILGDTKHPAGLGRPGRESWPETWPVVGVQFESALRGVASWSEDLLLASDRRGFLEECYFTYSHSPLKDASGDVVGVLSVVSETTAHVLAERRLRALAELSVATIDSTRRLDSINEMCQHLVDALCRDSPDVPFAALYLVGSPRDADRVAVAGADAAALPVQIHDGEHDTWGIADALRGPSPGPVVRAAPSGLPGGAWPDQTTELAVLPLFRSIEEGDLCGVLVVGINPRLHLDAPYREFLDLVAAQFGSAISALQFVQRERAARADAQNAARLRDEFLATLSHELRSPLNAVIGWTQILKRRETIDPAEIATAIEVIERNARLQTRLITDLLDVSRAISGNLSLELLDVDITKVIAAAAESVGPAAAAKGILLTTTLPANAPTVRGDPARLEQILWNLLANALKFTPPNGRVQVLAEPEGGWLRIRVIDDGEGIDPAFLPHLFQRFRQADASSSRRHQGLGLGLAIVKQFVELHGGRVSAASRGRGCGATFTLELPIAQSASSTRAPTTATNGSIPRIDLGGARVLVIDDQLDALRVLERIFDAAGAMVITASCAEEALDVLHKVTFDVLVSDIAMPGMDGYDFIAELARRGIETPAIALTAFALPDDVKRTISAGYKAHVSKPIDAAALLAAVTRLVRVTGPDV